MNHKEEGILLLLYSVELGEREDLFSFPPRLHRVERKDSSPLTRLNQVEKKDPSPFSTRLDQVGRAMSSSISARRHRVGKEEEKTFHSTQLAAKGCSARRRKRKKKISEQD